MIGLVHVRFGIPALLQHSVGAGISVTAGMPKRLRGSVSSVGTLVLVENDTANGDNTLTT